MLPHDDSPGVATLEHEDPKEDGGRVGEIDRDVVVEDADTKDPADPEDGGAVGDAKALE